MRYFVRRKLNERKIEIYSTYFGQRNFDGRKTKIILKHILWYNFDVQNIEAISMYFLRYNFDGRKIEKIASMYFFGAVSMENWCNIEVLNFMLLKDKKSRLFRFFSLLTFLNINTKVGGLSILDIIPFQCSFSK